MTRALITGISGFVGSHLAEYLLANTDWDIAGLMRWNASLDNLQELVPAINKGERINLFSGDLTDTWSIDALIDQTQPDYVFHLAAQSYVMASLQAPLETMRVNGEGTLNLLEAILRLAPKALIHNCSSSEVYGKVERSYGKITEQCPFSPSSFYAISKATADSLGRYYAEAYGLKVLTTRMFTHTGPRRGDVFMESSFAKQIAMIEAGQLEPPIMVGNLNATRTICDVRDAVRAYHMLLTVNPEPGAVYNIGGDHTCTAGSVLNALFDAAGVRYEHEVDMDRFRPIDADHQVPDCSRFKRATGWKPEVPFEQTIADLLEYWREKVKHGVPLLR